ncbi:AfsA-related hotdog domain-containing protein [Nocardia thailandica]|uniref:AfsA-related hotdog domain-containing protein n=1 Tax=Nocardia thailandica TaxID=257275 RepID=UPI0002FDE226|nr:AfsA-related hotdog domain-containing protein [Nocardia thailandica]
MSVVQLETTAAPAEQLATTFAVVADRFLGITTDDRVHTVSGLVALLRGGRFRATAAELTVYLGQGVTRHDLDYIEHVAAIHAPRARFRVVGEIAEPAARHHVHKYQDSNVLLAGLRREAENVFRADLRVDGDNELLLDHQTGEHVQGIVVIEAVRQLFLAAFELEHGVRRPEEHFYIVWNAVDLKFTSFLFPLPASLHATLTPIALEDPGKLEFAIETEVRQFGRTVATSRIGFTALPHERITQIERAKAAKAISAHLGLSA